MTVIFPFLLQQMLTYLILATQYHKNNFNNNNKVKSRLKYNNHPTQYSRLHANSITAWSILHEIDKKKCFIIICFSHSTVKTQTQYENKCQILIWSSFHDRLSRQTLPESPQHLKYRDVHPVHILSVFLKPVDVLSAEWATVIKDNPTCQ